MWLIPKVSLRCGSFPKSHYDVANSKYPTTTWQIQNPLRCGTIYKNRYDVTLFTKPVATRQYFTKSQNHFYKAQILIWHLFSQSPDSYLALFHKAQIPIWHYFSKPKFSFGIYFSQSPNSYLALFYKAQILIWHYFIKPKYYFSNSS